MYSNSSLSPFGKFENQIRDVTTKKKFKIPFTVVDDHLVKNNHLGCRAVQQMELIRVVTTNHINQVNNDQPMSDHIELTIAEIKETYHDFFEGLGNLGPELHLEEIPEVSAVQIPPKSLKQPLRQHLKQLVQQRVIEPGDYLTDWVSAIAVTLKPNGKIRLCLYPRPLNNTLKQCHHPIPTIDDVLLELPNGKEFTKVDCSNG